MWPLSGREAGLEAGALTPVWVGSPGPCSRGLHLELLSLLSRSHLQPPSYGPVLSPMSKAHGAVNKLPSVNQLVGQPPPHGSAAGSNLGPMGEWLGQGGWGGGWGSLAPDLPAQLRTARGS